jgi:hypothetical protein
MTRVLFWNIENFGLNKIYSTSLKRQRGHGGLTDAQAALQRRAVINAVNAAAQADIIVIVEVSSGDNAPNALASQTGGVEAMVYIQNRFNNALAPLPGGWGLVPPLYTGTGGRAETVGILYRRTDNAGTIVRYFTGPNIWTGGYAGLSRDPALGLLPVAYPTPAMVGGGTDFNAMLVPPGYGGVRAIPGGALHNAGLNENVVAARIAFNDTLGARIAFGGMREPFMATFTETNAAGVVQRNLTIFGIHSPPQGVAATNYMATLATMQDIMGPLGANETRIIGGDFNLNLFTANGTASGAYAPLTAGAGNYTLLVAPTAVGIPANVDQYVGYFSTHIRGKVKTAASKFLWSDVGGAGLSSYPGYGYVGSNFVAAPFYAIDNVLVWPHQGPPYNYNTTIMNPVVGTPMNAVAMPPDNPPFGALVLASQFGAPGGAWPAAPTAANFPGIGGASNLTSWANYGRIRNTSDHFGVVANV